jgi:uncharacterized protein (DUF433 family)
MPVLPELDPQISSEFEQLLRKFVESNSGWFASRWMESFTAPEFPSIVASPAVCGGAARLIRTRIPVWTLERMRQLGISESDILKSYPTLRAADLVQAWSYVDRHRDEIEKAIRDNEEG